MEENNVNFLVKNFYLKIYIDFDFFIIRKIAINMNNGYCFISLLSHF